MKKNLLLASLLALSFSALASGEKGNGGYSVVCRDSEGTILSAEILDIYEGKVLYKRKYPDSSYSVDTLLTVAKHKMKEHTSFAAKLEKEIQLVNSNVIFIPEGNILVPTGDALPVIKRIGCQFEQLANYTDEGELLVSQEIYDHLDNVNKAALILHEAIYSLRRKSRGDETSQNTRRLTAQILATNGDQTIIDRLAHESMYQPDAKKLPCGLKGSLEERIESCSYQSRPTANFYLVTRTTDMKEVYADRTKKTLWSDRLPSKMSQFMAEKACEDKDMPEMGYLTQYDWRLPDSQDYSSQHEFVSFVLPNQKGSDGAYWFWTTTVKANFGLVFDGVSGEMGYEYLSGKKLGSVRCIANYK